MLSRLLPAWCRHPINVNEALRVSGALQYPICLELVSEGKINVGSMITHRFGFSAEEIAAGFRCAADVGATKAVKVMFHLPDPAA